MEVLEIERGNLGVVNIALSSEDVFNPKENVKNKREID